MLTASLAPLGQNSLPDFLGFSAFEPLGAGLGESAAAIRVLSIAPAASTPAAPPARARNVRRLPLLCSRLLGTPPMKCSVFFFTSVSPHSGQALLVTVSPHCTL